MPPDAPAVNGPFPAAYLPGRHGLVRRLLRAAAPGRRAADAWRTAGTLLRRRPRRTARDAERAGRRRKPRPAGYARRGYACLVGLARRRNRIALVRQQRAVPGTERRRGGPPELFDGRRGRAGPGAGVVDGAAGVVGRRGRRRQGRAVALDAGPGAALLHGQARVRPARRAVRRPGPPSAANRRRTARAGADSAGRRRRVRHHARRPRPSWRADSRDRGLHRPL